MMKNRPQIKLNRLIVYKGNQIRFDEKFHSGVNILQGNNSRGKTTIFNFIFYILGGFIKSNEWSKESLNCDYLIAEASIGDEAIVIKREIDIDSKIKPFLVYAGNYESISDNKNILWNEFSYTKSDNKKSFSEFIFYYLNIQSDLTISKLLRLSYADQRSNYLEVFRSEDFDNQEYRRKISETLLGSYNADIYELEHKKRELEDRKKKLSKEIINYQTFYVKYKTSKDVNINIQKLDKKIEEFKENIESLQDKKISIISKSSDLKKNADKIKKIESSIFNISKDIEGLKLQNLESQYLIDKLENKLYSLDKAGKMKQSLDNLELTSCPECYTTLNKNIDSTKCYLCKEDMNEDQISSQIGKMKFILDSQIKESKSLIEDRTLLINDYKKEKRKLLNDLKSYKNKSSIMLSLDDDFSSSMYSLSKNLANAEQQKEILFDALIELENYEKYASNIKGVNDELKDLDKDINTKIVENMKTMNPIKLNIVDRMKDYLDIDKREGGKEQTSYPVNKSNLNIDIDFKMNQLYLTEKDSGNRYSLSASTMSMLKNSFYISSFFETLSNNKCNFPKFMMLDNFQDKGILNTRVNAMIKEVITSSDEYISKGFDHQLLISVSDKKDGEEFDFDERYIIDQYYGDKYTLKKIGT